MKRSITVTCYCPFKDLENGILAADPRSSNINAHVHSNGNILWIPPVSHKVVNFVVVLAYRVVKEHNFLAVLGIRDILVRIRIRIP